MQKGYLIYLLLLLILLVAMPLSAQVDYTKQDSIIVEDYIKQFRDKRDLSSGDLMVATALYFRNKPYVASTLDKNKEERLVVNLREFDCNTFVETCIALVETIKNKNHSFDDFCLNLQNMRYRNGVINDYSSRMHYVSDWSFENGKKGTIVDKSKSLGGILQNQQINFMSSHPNSYQALQNNADLVREIINIENNINERNHFYIIPKQKINEVQSKIKNGDIIAFATSINGLDYSHIGIAYRVNGTLSFIHASTRTMSVIVEPRSLRAYCDQQKKCIGISVFALN